MKKFLIKVNGNQYEVEVEEVKEVAQVAQNVVNNIALESKTQEAPKVQKKVEQSVKKEANIACVSSAITAPMPGTILKTSVSVGEVVKKGQVLLVLEAMKMENDIVAIVDGTVASVNVEKGESVSAGDVLVAFV